MRRRNLFQATHGVRNSTGLPGPGVGPSLLQGHTWEELHKFPIVKLRSSHWPAWGAGHLDEKLCCLRSWAAIAALSGWLSHHPEKRFMGLSGAWHTEPLGVALGPLHTDLVSRSSG